MSIHKLFSEATIAQLCEYKEDQQITVIQVRPALSDTTKHWDWLAFWFRLMKGGVVLPEPQNVGATVLLVFSLGSVFHVKPKQNTQ